MSNIGIQQRDQPATGQPGMTAGFGAAVEHVTAMSMKALGDMLDRSGPCHVDGPVVHVKAALTPAHCDEVVNAYRTRDSIPLPSINDGGVGALTVDLVDDYYAGDPFLWQNIDVWFRWFNLLNEAMWNLDTVMVGGPAFDPEHANIKMLHFEPGCSLGSHADGLLDPRCRIIGVVVYLTDPDHYEGGDLIVERAADVVTVDAPTSAFEFQFDATIDHRIRPRQGDLMFFPGHIEHEVEALTSGTRNVLAVFVREVCESVEGPQIAAD